MWTDSIQGILQFLHRSGIALATTTTAATVPTLARQTNIPSRTFAC